MKVIALANPKGGCGKTTLTTNLAVFLSGWGLGVMILDVDSQSSSLDWGLARQNHDLTRISVVSTRYEQLVTRLQKARASDDPDTVILVDLPAAFPAERELALHPLIDAILYPFIASPIDVRAMVHHLFQLNATACPDSSGPQSAVIMNRALPHTRLYRSVQQTFVQRISYPLIGELRETQNYPAAAAMGKGLLELPLRQVIKDLVQWKPILQWLARTVFSDRDAAAFNLFNEALASHSRKPPGA